MTNNARCRCRPPPSKDRHTIGSATRYEWIDPCVAKPAGFGRALSPPTSALRPAMLDLLTAIQIACLLLLILGAPAYAVLRLYWRAEAAEYQLRNERLKSSRLEREVRQLEEALADAQRGAVEAVAAVADSSQHAPAARAAPTQRPQDRS